MKIPDIQIDQIVVSHVVSSGGFEARRIIQGRGDNWCYGTSGFGASVVLALLDREYQVDSGALAYGRSQMAGAAS